METRGKKAMDKDAKGGGWHSQKESSGNCPCKHSNEVKWDKTWFTSEEERRPLVRHKRGNLQEISCRRETSTYRPMLIPRECFRHIGGNKTSPGLMGGSSISTEPSTFLWPENPSWLAIHGRDTGQERNMKWNTLLHWNQVQMYRNEWSNSEELENKCVNEKSGWTITILKHRIWSVIQAGAVDLQRTRQHINFSNRLSHSIKSVQGANACYMVTYESCALSKVPSSTQVLNYLLSSKATSSDNFSGLSVSTPRSTVRTTTLPTWYSSR